MPPIISFHLISRKQILINQQADLRKIPINDKLNE
jgi:hypothetical protein